MQGGIYIYIYIDIYIYVGILLLRALSQEGRTLPYKQVPIAGGIGDRRTAFTNRVQQTRTNWAPKSGKHMFHERRTAMSEQHNGTGAIFPTRQIHRGPEPI